MTMKTYVKMSVLNSVLPDLTFNSPQFVIRNNWSNDSFEIRLYKEPTNIYIGDLPRVVYMEPWEYGSVIKPLKKSDRIAFCSEISNLFLDMATFGDFSAHRTPFKTLVFPIGMLERMRDNRILVAYTKLLSLTSPFTFNRIDAQARLIFRSAHRYCKEVHGGRVYLNDPKEFPNHEGEIERSKYWHHIQVSAQEQMSIPSWYHSQIPAFAEKLEKDKAEHVARLNR